MTIQATPTLSVVIVNWNSKSDLVDCLASLEQQIDREFETIVVDNGSTDGSGEIVRERFPWVRLVETGKNLGFSGGCNRGIEASSSEWVGMLNNDTTADPAWIGEMRLAARNAEARLGMLQSMMVFKQHPDRTNSTGIVMFTNGTAMDRDFDVPVRPQEVADEILCPTAGAALYRREMLEAVQLSTGYFDASYFLYFEDVDLGWRARLCGWKACYVPTAIVHHAFQGSSGRHGKAKISLHMKRNRIRTLIKNGSFRFLLRTIPYTVGELAEAVWKEGGIRVLPSFARAAMEARLLRREVDRLVREPRLKVERRWLRKRKDGSQR